MAAQERMLARRVLPLGALATLGVNACASEDSGQPLMPVTEIAPATPVAPQPAAPPPPTPVPASDPVPDMPPPPMDVAPPSAAATLATEQDSPRQILIDASSVYWVNAGANGSEGAVRRVSKQGGAVSTLATEQGTLRGFSMDESRLYWLESRTGEMRSVAKDAGDLGDALGSAQVELVADSLGQTKDLAVAASGFYFTTLGSVMRLAPGSTEADSLWGSFSALPQQIAVHGDHVYWTTSQSVMRSALDGTNPETLTASGGTTLLVDAAGLLWLNAREIMAAPLAGGGVRSLATAAFDATDLGSDGELVVWSSSAADAAASDSGSGQLSAVPRQGGTPRTLLAESGYSGVAVDPTHVYFTSSAAGVVGKVPR